MIANIIKSKYFKRILSLLIVICVAFTAMLPSITYGTKANSATKKMIHIISDGSSKVEFLKDVSLVKNTEYSVSFKYVAKDGAFGRNEAITFNVFAKNKNGVLKEIFGDSFNSTDSRYTSPVYDSETQTVTYNFTLKDDTKNKMPPNNVTLATGANDCGIGFIFANGKTAEMYITEIAIWKTSDADKTNLLGEINTATDLNGWRSIDNVASGTIFTDGGMTATLTKYENVAFDPDAIPEIYTPAKMVYYKNTVSETLGKQTSVQNGKTYNLEFCLANDVASMNEVQTNDIIIEAFANNTNKDNVAITYNLIKKYTYEKYLYVVYSVTVPDDIEIISANGAITIGPKFPTNSECYIFNMTMYLADDLQKKGILYGEDLSEGLVKFSIGNSISIPDLVPAGSTLLSDNTEWYLDTEKSKHIKTVAFDESLFKDVVSNGPTVEPPEKMLYYKNNEKQFVGKTVTVEKGKSYDFTFSFANDATAEYLVGMGDLEITAISLSDYSEINVKPVIKSRTNDEVRKYTTVTYTITIKNSVSTIMIGVRVPSKSKVYLFNMHIYDTSSADDSNIFSNTGFGSGLDTVALGTEIMSGGLTEWNTQDYSKHLKVVDYNDSLFAELVADNAPHPDRKMLYLKAGSYGPLYQRFSATAGGVYNLTFSMTNSIDEFSIAAASDGDRPGINVKAEPISKENKGNYSVYNYEITFPEDMAVGSDGTVLVFLGLNFGTGSEGYIFDFILTKKDDISNKQLYSNHDFRGGLSNWAWGWSVWFGVVNENSYDWTDNSTILKVEAFDIEKVNKFTLPDNRKMVYFKNGANQTHFAAWVSSNQGKNMILTYSVYATENISPAFVANGDRWGVSVKTELLNKVEQDNYTTYTYRFSVPLSYSDGLIFIGFDIMPLTEGYLFDMNCYLEDDPNKKNLWSNGKFKVNLDGWIWGWNAWFNHPADGSDGGLTSWANPNGSDVVELKNYDLAHIDALIADLNRDDGEWWNPDDILKEEDFLNKSNIAKISGVVTDQNNNPLKGIKLLLKGVDNSYNTTTDANGKFEFKDIKPAYYELFFINNKGQEVSTQFFSTLSNNDSVEMTIVCDVSELEAENTDNSSYESENEEDENEIAVTSFSGTVYTPQLKTVAGLKICLRGFDDTVTDENGNFAFEDVPVGEYELYAVSKDGSEYIFRTVTLEENVKLSTKLKYDPNGQKADTNNVEETSNIWVWIIISGAAVLVIGGGVVAFILIRKKKLSIN